MIELINDIVGESVIDQEICIFIKLSVKVVKFVCFWCNFCFISLVKRIKISFKSYLDNIQFTGWCKSKNETPYFECSAKENVNVEQAFQSIAKQALLQEADVVLSDFPKKIDLQANKSNQGGNNCSC